ncbi:MAG: hypothetical protein LQ341_002502, partial [Variospora aurantia]
GPRIANTTHQNALKATRIAANLAATWFPVDGNWSYRFIGTEFGTQFVKEHFRGQPDIVDVYNSLRVPVMASDFLRYLLLAGDGGVYADSDVEMIKPLQDWVPVPYRNVARAMIGVEKDHPAKDEPDGWSFRFVQHTLITAKAHPIMVNMVRNITDKMLQLSHEKDTPLSQLELHDRDVVRITGPRGFKDVVFEHLSGEMGESIGWRNVTKMKEPKLFGDTLIVPINFFAAGQQHSGSDGTSPDKRVQHYWSGTWRHWDESIKRTKSEQWWERSQPQQQTLPTLRLFLNDQQLLNRNNNIEVVIATAATMRYTEMTVMPGLQIPDQEPACISTTSKEPPIKDRRLPTLPTRGAASGHALVAVARPRRDRG